ncbi:MAG TPA: hypothetical protein VFG63_06825 [Nocardioidaceae bacterium]|nr:hypothetical protein [Nocardioidaceae bacterium]
MRRGLSFAAATVAAMAAPVLISPAAHADSGREQISLAFDEPPVTTSVSGLGPGCPSFQGDLTEYRHVQIDGFIGPDGTAHARSLVTASLELVPREEDDPSYTGGYTARQTGMFENAGDDERVVTTTTHGMLEGSDGTSYGVNEVAHFSLSKDGTIRAWFDRMHCG